MRIFDPPAIPASGPEFAISEDHKFICEPIMPAGAISNLFYAVQSEDLTRRAAGLLGVIRSVLSDDDIDRFNEIVYGTEINVPLSLLQEIVEYLVGEYTGRPTTPSSGSPAGSTPTPATSEDGSSANAST